MKLILVTVFLFFACQFISAPVYGSDLTADGNSDCTVDGLDYVIWLNHYGTQTSNGKSNGNFSYQSGDQSVDGVDYVIWLNQYGRTCEPTNTPTVTPTPTPTNTFRLKVLAINFNPAEGNRNVAQTYFNSVLAGKTPDQFLDNKFQWNIDNFNTLSKNEIQYKIVKTITINTFPTYSNGYQFTLDDYGKCLSGQKLSNGSSCEEQKWKFDMSQWLSQQQICQQAESVNADEIWILTHPYIMTYENNLIGPDNGFGVNGPSYKNISCQKYHVIHNITYNRWNNFFHNYGHRLEATMSYLTQKWQSSDKNKYWENFANVSRYANNITPDQGCGNTHFPLNASSGYDCSNKTVKSLNCSDWKNFPDFTGQTEQINCNAWGCSDYGWQMYWFKSIPRGAGETAMISANGKTFNFKKNWWYYFLYPQNAIDFNAQF